MHFNPHHPQGGDAEELGIEIRYEISIHTTLRVVWIEMHLLQMYQGHTYCHHLAGGVD